MTEKTRYHSVVLDEEACKGCTVCVTTCPAGAIRVWNGKARILAERCIDCGECIRRCPNHAKKALSDVFPDAIRGKERERFDRIVALPAPSLYGQFPDWSVDTIHEALLANGFDDVYPVAAATPDIARATRSFLDREKYPDLPRPLISSSCPTIIKLVQIRFPTLLGNIVPVIAPMEYAGRLARTRALDRTGGTDPRRIGVFFISPCAGKITEAKAPMGNETSSIDGVLSMKDLHLPLLVTLTKLGKKRETPDATARATEIAWGRAGGEAEATIPDREYVSLSVDGMDQCIGILNAVEDGKLSGIDFLELMACTYGCVGGPLSVTNPAIARHAIRERELVISGKRKRSGKERTEGDDARDRAKDCIRAGKFPSRPPALLLDPDYKKAMRMMEEMEGIYKELPGLDCGCCGAPGCHALAEDIVRGTASRTDCVIILKEQYRELVDKNSRKKK